MNLFSLQIILFLVFVATKMDYNSGSCHDLIFVYFCAKENRPIKDAGKMPRTCWLEN